MPYNNLYELLYAYEARAFPHVPYVKHACGVPFGVCFVYNSPDNTIEI